MTASSGAASRLKSWNIRLSTLDAEFLMVDSLRAWEASGVREAMELLGMERDDEPQDVVTTTGAGAMEFDTAPGLAFTKPLSASINGKAVHSPRWSSMLLTMIAQLKAKGLEGEKLVRELQVPAKAERYEDKGFKYHADLGVSIQGQSASDAWKEIDRLAKKWAIPVTIEFWWRQNPKAQYPGRTGILRSGGA